MLYENAVKETQRIVLNAERKAESIRGDAYRSLREEDKNCRNRQSNEKCNDGYSNEYIIPAYTLLDDLADDMLMNTEVLLLSIL